MIIYIISSKRIQYFKLEKIIIFKVVFLGLYDLFKIKSINI